jgi:hypothetical protein
LYWNFKNQDASAWTELFTISRTLAPKWTIHTTHLNTHFWPSAKPLRRMTITYTMSVRPSIRNNLTLTGQIFVKFCPGDLHYNLSIPNFFKTKKNWTFTQKSTYIYFTGLNHARRLCSLCGKRRVRRNSWRPTTSMID